MAMRNGLPHLRGIDMRESIRRSIAVVVVIAALALAQSRAFAQTMSFDLPAQPLADSLKAIANQTNTNVLFDLKLVEGVRAPSLKAQLTAEGAVEQLLTGTQFTHELVNEHTI